MKTFFDKHLFSILVGVMVTLIVIVSGALVFVMTRPSESVGVQQKPEVTVVTPPETNTCSENWTCGAWSACERIEETTEGQRTRTCTDLNSCGTTEIRPRLTESCEPFIFEEPELGPFDIEIRGDERCQADITGALNILEERAPEYYSDVRKYVGVIECVEGDISRAFESESPPRAEISPTSENWSLEYIASVIVHEMIHSKLYNDYLIENRPNFYIVPECAYRGLRKELEITEEQIEVLKSINGRQREIDGLIGVLDDPFDFWVDLNCQ